MECCRQIAWVWVILINFLNPSIETCKIPCNWVQSQIVIDYSYLLDVLELVLYVFLDVSNVCICYFLIDNLEIALSTFLLIFSWSPSLFDSILLLTTSFNLMVLISPLVTVTIATRLDVSFISLYMILHYLPTRESLKTSFMVSGFSCRFWLITWGLTITTNSK